MVADSVDACHDDIPQLWLRVPHDQAPQAMAVDGPGGVRELHAMYATLGKDSVEHRRRTLNKASAAGSVHRLSPISALHLIQRISHRLLHQPPVATSQLLSNLFPFAVATP